MGRWKHRRGRGRWPVVNGFFCKSFNSKRNYIFVKKLLNIRFMKRNSIFILFLCLTMNLFSQSKITDGTYLFLRDNDGSEPREDAKITLQFTSGKLYLLAVMPEETVEDYGKYTLTNGKLSIVFDSFEFGCTKADFTYEQGY
jgi:hypothetical protein